MTNAPGLVLGIDAGLSCGWALYQPGKVANCGVLDLRCASDLGERLSEYRHFLGMMLQVYPVALVAFERPFGRRGFTSDLPGVLVAVGHMVAHEAGIPRREFTASAVKKGATGSGKASKGAVLDAMRDRFGFDPATDHEADAAAVAVLAWAREAQA